MKYVIRHAQGDEKGTVIDGDSLNRWLDAVRQADAGDQDAREYVGQFSGYVAGRLRELIGTDGDA